MLFRLPLHRRRVPVFHLEPIVRSAARIPRAAPFADNPFAAELARVIEDSRAGVIEHAVEDERQRLAFGQEPRQLGLALLDRLVPQIASVKLD